MAAADATAEAAAEVAESVKYDWIEIGTSDFDTLIEKAKPGERGASVEPLKYYLDRLPSPPGVEKVNAAVSDHDGKLTMHYVSDAVVAAQRLPRWVRGCNSVHTTHAAAADILRRRGLDPANYFSKEEVECITWKTLIERLRVSGIGFLKTDTEGHDVVILKQVVELGRQCPHLLPKKIQFESNQCTPASEIDMILTELLSLGYELMYRGLDTVVVLTQSAAA